MHLNKVETKEGMKLLEAIEAVVLNNLSTSKGQTLISFLFLSTFYVQSLHMTLILSNVISLCSYNSPDIRYLCQYHENYNSYRVSYNITYF